MVVFDYLRRFWIQKMKYYGKKWIKKRRVGGRGGGGRGRRRSKGLHTNERHLLRPLWKMETRRT